MEPGFLRSLFAAFEDFVRAWERPGSDARAAMDELRPRLQRIIAATRARAAAADLDDIPPVVSLVGLVIDCARGVIGLASARTALDALRTGLSAETMEAADLVLQGEEVTAADDADLRRSGCTMMPWAAYRTLIAEEAYGVAKSFGHEEEHWRALEAGRLRLADEDLHVGRENGVVWITDEQELRRHCTAPGGDRRVDGAAAYDRLALDWTRRWEHEENGIGECRSVLLSAPVERRRRGDRGLRLPTALDGWWSALFVSSASRAAGPFPQVGSRTVHPVTGVAGLPEAVHGRLEVARGEEFAVEPCTKVTGSADRLADCGVPILDRLRERLGAL